MQRFTYVLLLILCAVFSACDGYTTVSSASGEPQLQQFHVVDSYGYSTDDRYVSSSAIDPYVNDGLFEVYWYARSFYDYWVTVSINRYDHLAGGIILSEELCGYDYSCDYDGMQLCEYNSDGTMGCGADLSEVHYNTVSIDPLLHRYPDYLYLNIEICDDSGWSCETLSRPVTLY